MAVDMSMLSYFKDLYSGHKIIYVRFLHNEFVFRTLTKAEYKSIYRINDGKFEVQDAICNTCCLYPEEYDFSECGYAGLNEKVADLIENMSGFTDIQVVLDDYYKAKNIKTLEQQAMDLIKAFIPEYTYDEMKDWSWQKLMEMTVHAENIAALHHFDWHLEDQSKEYKEDMNSIQSDNKEFVDELYKSGIDPMFYFQDEIKSLTKVRQEVLDFPLISSGRWKDEALLNVIRQQKSSRRR